MNWRLFKTDSKQYQAKQGLESLKIIDLGFIDLIEFTLIY